MRRSALSYSKVSLLRQRPGLRCSLENLKNIPKYSHLITDDPKLFQLLTL